MKVILLIAAGVYAAGAHDLYLMPSQFTVAPGDSVMISIHNGDSFPISEGATDPRRVISPAISDLRVLGNATHGFVRVAAAGSVVVSAQTEPKTFTLASPKFESYLKEEGLDHVIAMRRSKQQSATPGRETYSKHAKTILISGEPDATYATPLGLPIEFVPESLPTTAKSVRVQVLFQGRPAPGLQVEKAHSSGKRTVVGRTDNDGRIDVAIDAPGRWRLHTVCMVSAENSAEADWRSYWASLTFESKP